MNTRDIIHAWKDELFRKSLSLEELQSLPDHPAGMVELTMNELAQIVGSAIDPKTVVVFCPPFSHSGNC